jgi:hypothetical protein
MGKLTAFSGEAFPFVSLLSRKFSGAASKTLKNLFNVGAGPISKTLAKLPHL